MVWAVRLDTTVATATYHKFYISFLIVGSKFLNHHSSQRDTGASNTTVYAPRHKRKLKPAIYHRARVPYQCLYHPYQPVWRDSACSPFGTMISDIKGQSYKHLFSLSNPGLGVLSSRPSFTVLNRIARPPMPPNRWMQPILLSTISWYHAWAIAKEVKPYNIGRVFNRQRMSLAHTSDGNPVQERSHLTHFKMAGFVVPPNRNTNELYDGVGCSH